jgi:thiamine biosynthesis lipoprotein
MPLQETLPVDAGTDQWPIWSTTARLVVTDPAALPVARSIVDTELSAVELACSRFRADSELNQLEPGRPVRISPRLAELVAVALAAAERTGGDVDPTVGGALFGLGYDRDFGSLVDGGISVFPAPDWRRVRLDGSLLTVPPGIRLDLGATAKAFTADRCAELVAEALGVGVLVSLGGDIATAGPSTGWRVLVQDGPSEPACTVVLPAGQAIACVYNPNQQYPLMKIPGGPYEQGFGSCVSRLWS